VKGKTFYLVQVKLEDLRRQLVELDEYVYQHIEGGNTSYDTEVLLGAANDALDVAYHLWNANEKEITFDG